MESEVGVVRERKKHKSELTGTYVRSIPFQRKKMPKQTKPCKFNFGWMKVIDFPFTFRLNWNGRE